MTAASRKLGISGEAAAAQWYLDRGFQVVAQNWRAGRQGEIDLIARKGSLCAICEVKTRTSSAFGTAAESVTAVKQRKLRTLAAAWLAAREEPGWLDVRFDVACVDSTGAVDMIEAAF